jgi:hypothetical protein
VTQINNALATAGAGNASLAAAGIQASVNSSGQLSFTSSKAFMVTSGSAGATTLLGAASNYDVSLGQNRFIGPEGVGHGQARGVVARVDDALTGRNLVNGLRLELSIGIQVILRLQGRDVSQNIKGHLLHSSKLELKVGLIPARRTLSAWSLLTNCLSVGNWGT